MKISIPSFLRRSRSSDSRSIKSCQDSPRISSPSIRSCPEESQHEELARVFRHFDVDGDGKISVSELVGVLRLFGEGEISDKGVGEVVKEVDSDGDGCIDFDDFVRLNEVESSRVGGNIECEEEVLMAAFRLFEMEKGECITPRSLHRTMVRLGETVSEEECRLMIREADSDGDGVVNFEEFKHMMTAKSG